MITRPISLVTPNTANLLPSDRLMTIPNQLTDDHLRGLVTERSVVPPGRTAGLELLSRIPSRYESDHVYPMNTTSLLSAHIKFGTVSIREVYLTAVRLQGQYSEFVRQVI